MAKKDIHFYTELVIVTVLSIVAARAWFHWLSRFLNQYVGTSIHIDFLAAVILTVVAIFGLNLLFSRQDIKKDIPPPHGLIYHEDPHTFRPPGRYLKRHTL